MIVSIILLIAEAILPASVSAFLRRLLKPAPPQDDLARVRAANEAVKKVDTSDAAIARDPDNAGPNP